MNDYNYKGYTLVFKYNTWNLVCVYINNKGKPVHSLYGFFDRDEAIRYAKGYLKANKLTNNQ